MYLFQTKYKDRKGDEKKCKTWYIAFKDHLEIEYRIAGDKNKDAATNLGKLIDRFVWYKKAGRKPDLDDLNYLKNEVPDRIRTKLIKLNIIDKQICGVTSSLEEHLEAYREKLQVGFRKKKKKKGEKALQNTERHVKAVYNEVKRIIDGCGFKTWSDIHFKKVDTFLRNLDVGGKTANYYIRDFNQFVRWAIEDEREHMYPAGKKLEFWPVDIFKRIVIGSAVLYGPFAKLLAGPQKVLFCQVTGRA